MGPIGEMSSHVTRQGTLVHSRLSSLAWRVRLMRASYMILTYKNKRRQGVIRWTFLKNFRMWEKSPNTTADTLKRSLTFRLINSWKSPRNIYCLIRIHKKVTTKWLGNMYPTFCSISVCSILSRLKCRLTKKSNSPVKICQKSGDNLCISLEERCWCINVQWLEEWINRKEQQQKTGGHIMHG